MSVTSYPEAEDLPSDVAGGYRVEAGGCQNGRIVIVSGKVVDGCVEVDSELPEGASVTVLACEGDPETDRILRDAIARCERGETVPIAQLLGELRYRA